MEGRDYLKLLVFSVIILVSAYLVSSAGSISPEALLVCSGGVIFVGAKAISSFHKHNQERLKTAVEKDDFREVEKLFKDNAHIPIPARFNNKIHNQNYWRITSRLIEKGASGTLKDKDGCTPLMFLVMNGSLRDEIRDFLARFKPSLRPRICTAVNDKGQNVLMVGAGRMSREASEYLIKSGADPLAKDLSGDSVLIYATRVRDFNLVKLLPLTDINQKDRSGRTPIMIANTGPNRKFTIVRYLFKKGADLQGLDPGIIEILSPKPIESKQQTASEFDYIKVDEREKKKEDLSAPRAYPRQKDTTAHKLVVSGNPVADGIRARRTFKEHSAKEEEKKKREDAEKQRQKKLSVKQEVKQEKTVGGVHKREVYEMQEQSSASSASSSFTPTAELSVTSLQTTEIVEDKESRPFTSSLHDYFISNNFGKIQGLTKLKAKGSAVYGKYVNPVRPISVYDLDVEMLLEDFPDDIGTAIKMFCDILKIEKTHMLEFTSRTNKLSGEVEWIQFKLMPQFTKLDLPLNFVIRNANYPNNPLKDWVLGPDALREIYVDVDKNIKLEDRQVLSICSDLQNYYKISRQKSEASVIDNFLEDIWNGHYPVNTKNLSQKVGKKYFEKGMISADFLEKFFGVIALVPASASSSPYPLDAMPLVSEPEIEELIDH